MKNFFSASVKFSDPDTKVLKKRPNLILETKMRTRQDFPWPRQVVKRFQWRGLQRFFSPVKTSKAVRSYQTACHLIKHGLSTPMPLGAVEFRKSGFIINNAYITEAVNDYIDLKTYRSSLPDGREGMTRVLEDLATYILKMHDSGLWHRDLNLSNFLLTGKPGGHRLYLIDLNRARVKPGLSSRDRAKDLARLDLNEWQKIFFSYYCANRFNPQEMLRTANIARSGRRAWRKMIVWTNPLRRKLGMK